MPYEFLTDEWIEAVLALQGEYRDRVTPPEESIVLNVVVRDVPFAMDDLELFVDTRSGLAEVGEGHSDDGEVKVTTDYATAKSMVVDQDQQALMQAMLAGKVSIEGDLAKLMVMQANATMPSDEVLLEAGRRLRELTAD